LKAHLHLMLHTGSYWTGCEYFRVTLYSLGADSTEKSVVLLVSSDRTENISRGCYCRVATNCRIYVFTSALRSNERGAATLYTVACVLTCLLSCCIATVAARTHCCVRYPTTSSKHSFFQDTILLLRAFRGFCGWTIIALGKYAKIRFHGLVLTWLGAGITLFFFFTFVSHCSLNSSHFYLFRPVFQ
jgi:hypothetical protein